MLHTMNLHKVASLCVPQRGVERNLCAAAGILWSSQGAGLQIRREVGSTREVGLCRAVHSSCGIGLLELVSASQTIAVALLWDERSLCCAVLCRAVLCWQAVEEASTPGELCCSRRRVCQHWTGVRGVAQQPCVFCCGFDSWRGIGGGVGG
jgi:hypothetical protein